MSLPTKVIALQKSSPINSSKSQTEAEEVHKSTTTKHMIFPDLVKVSIDFNILNHLDCNIQYINNKLFQILKVSHNFLHYAKNGYLDFLK